MIGFNMLRHVMGSVRTSYSLFTQGSVFSFDILFQFFSKGFRFV